MKLQIVISQITPTSIIRVIIFAVIALQKCNDPYQSTKTIELRKHIHCAYPIPQGQFNTQTHSLPLPISQQQLNT